MKKDYCNENEHCDAALHHDCDQRHRCFRQGGKIKYITRRFKKQSPDPRLIANPANNSTQNSSSLRRRQRFGPAFHHREAGCEHYTSG
jgi:hypothetical protein